MLRPAQALLLFLAIAPCQADTPPLGRLFLDQSLLIMDGLSLVASVPNRTIITAVPRGETADTVFTNIDSAVVVAKASTATETME